MSPALIVHISAGGAGLLTGAVALTARKGETLHKAVGKAFCVAMLVMSSSASWLAAIVPGQIGNLPGAVFTFYLVCTAWATVRRPAGVIGWPERIALVIPFTAAAVLAWFSWLIVTQPTLKMLHGAPPIASFIGTAVVSLVAVLDLKVVIKGGISGAGRIARHLWRMCVGFFVATGSFFIGKQMDMPAFVRGSPVLMLLAFAPLLLMLFWLARVGLTRQFRDPVAA